AFQDATRLYVEQGKDLDKVKKGFDSCKILKPGYQTIKVKILEKWTLFNCLNKI
ncbi:MAG: fructose-bisphosphate aldolase, partial [Malacoplasma sp.]|nr:fructose-bisphosphate aldolase [Malacoplasma sp.]